MRPIRLKSVSKYRAVKTTVDGITFASKKEAARYAELKLLEKAGAISGIELQPGYVLYVPRADGPVSVGVYKADFAYTERGDRIVEDVKGVRTPVYRLKKKMVEATYGVQIREL